jgi:hypothetical protein
MAKKNREELKEIDLLLRQIKKSYGEIGENNPFEGKSITDFVGKTHELRDALDEANEVISNMDGGIGELHSAWKAVVEEVGGYNNAQRSSKSEISKITELVGKFKSHQKGVNILSEKELKILQTKVALSKDELRSNLGELQKRVAELSKIKNIQGKEKAELLNKEILISNINGMLHDEKSLLKESNREIQESIDKQKSNEKAIGAMGSILKGISKIPILGDVIDSKEILEKVNAELNLTDSNTGKWRRGMIAVNATMGAIKSQFIEGILNPANVINGAIVMMGKAITMVDSGAGDMAKSMNITYSEALGVRKELTGIANASYDTNVNTKDLQETMMYMNGVLGARVNLNKEDLIIFTKLREQAGLTNDELYGLQQITTLNNSTLDQTNTKLLGATRVYNAKNKLALNEKEILKDVSKMTASLKLSLGNNVDKMAQAAMKAKEFGLNLEQASSMSQSLLNFESSIESELSAELLVGRDLNLERARGLALNGDTAAAAAEIARQMGSASDFGKMNVIQQEAIAKAAGLSRDDLAKSLIDKEALQKLGVKDAKTAKEAYDTLKAQGMSEAQIAQKLGSEENARMYEQQSIQDEFNKSVEKLQDLFVGVANAIMPVLDKFSGIFKIMGYIDGWTGGWLGNIVGLAAGLGGILVITQQILNVKKAITASTIATNIASAYGHASAAIALATEQKSVNFSTLKLALEKETLLTKMMGYGMMLKEVALEKIKSFFGKQGLMLSIQTLAIKTATLIKEKAGAIASIVSGAWSSLGKIPIVGPFLAGAAIGGGVGYLVSKMNDGEINKDGKPTLYTGTDQIQLNPNDSIYSAKDGSMKVGTDLLGEKKNNSIQSNVLKSPSQTTNPQQQNIEPKIDMRETNELLKHLINTTSKDKTIEFDGRKVNNTTSISSYRVN